MHCRERNKKWNSDKMVYTIQYFRTPLCQTNDCLLCCFGGIHTVNTEHRSYNNKTVLTLTSITLCTWNTKYDKRHSNVIVVYAFPVKIARYCNNFSNSHDSGKKCSYVFLSDI